MFQNTKIIPPYNEVVFVFLWRLRCALVLLLFANHFVLIYYIITQSFNDFYMKRPYVLLIVDGFGIDTPSKSNAVALADKYNLDNLVSNYFATTLYAHGEFVGLPFGVVGDSETGHMNIGAGKIVYQDILKINKSIKDKSFFVNQYFLNAILKAQKNKKNLHLIGTLSYDSSNSFVEHFYSLIEIIKSENLKNFYVHIILDGKDFDNNSGVNIVSELNDKFNILGYGKIATISGRSYGMDRDLNWDKTEKAYNAIVVGNADRYYDNPVEAVEESYKEGIFDDQIKPTVIIDKNKKPVATINDGDSVIFFNFKQDKIRQLAKSIIQDNFDNFEKTKELKDVYYVTMTEYEKDLPCDVVFKDENIDNTLVNVLSENNVTQLHVSETEKYPHVTFFLNGQKDQIFKGEERLLIPSPHAFFDELEPEMNLFKMSNEIVDYINEERIDFIVANLPNAELMGHSGNIKKTIKAVQAIDRAIGEITDAVLNKNGVVFITSDHGNAENMIFENHSHKDHTSNPVPFIVVGREFLGRNVFANFNMLSSCVPSGVLADITPTILKIMNIKKPEDMTGREIV